MNWIDYCYPTTVHIVEVKYSGDIAITTCRCNDEPKEKDNSRGFTVNFTDYQSAQRYAKHVAQELGIGF